MNFLELLKRGKVQPEDIDDYIDKWHDEYTGDVSLEEFLGMTKQQYFDWVVNPDSIKSLYCSECSREMVVAKRLMQIADELSKS